MVVVLPDAASARDFTVYDAYVDAQGLIFHTDSERHITSSRLRPVRQDVGNNPLEVRPEHSDVFAQGDFRWGMGQKLFHKEGRNPSMYLLSDGLDISKEGEVSLLKRPVRAVDGATNLQAAAFATAGDRLFVAQSTGGVGDNVRHTPDLSTWTTEDLGIAGDPTVLDLTTRGAEVFAAVNNDAVRIRSSAGTWSAWEPGGSGTGVLDVNARLIAYHKGRIIVTGGKAADGVNYNRKIFEVTSSASPTHMTVLPEGWEWTDIAPLGSFIYAAAVNRNAGLSVIYHFGLDSTASTLEEKGSTEMPHNSFAYSLLSAGGVLWIGGGANTGFSGNSDPEFWQGIPSEGGSLTLLKLAGLPFVSDGSAVDAYIQDIAIQGNTLFFGFATVNRDVSPPVPKPMPPPWPQNRTGIAAYDISRGAFYLHQSVDLAGVSAMRVSAVTVFKNRIIWGTQADHLYYSHDAELMSEGTLISSVADWNNAGHKTWRRLEIETDPLPAGASINVYYTLQDPEEDSWTLATTHNTEGATQKTVDLTDVESPRVALKFVLNRATDPEQGPVLRNYSVWSDPSPQTPSWEIVTSFLILPEQRSSGFGAVTYSDPRQIVSNLQDELHNWVDYHERNESYSVRVEAVRVAALPTVSETTDGDTHDEGYLVTLAMRGTRI